MKSSIKPRSRSAFLFWLGIISCAAWLGGCSKKQGNQPAAGKTISITLNGNFGGTVTLENGPADSRVRVLATRSQSTPGLPMTGALTISSADTVNPASKGGEIYARPFRGKDLVLKEFTLGTGWSIWHNERLLYQPPPSSGSGPAELPAGTPSITSIDFVKSTFGGKVVVRQGNRVIATEDLYSPQENWITVNIPASGLVTIFTAAVADNIENPVWIFKPVAGATEAPTVVGATFGDLTATETNLNGIVKLPPQAGANNTFTVPVTTP